MKPFKNTPIFHAVLTLSCIVSILQFNACKLIEINGTFAGLTSQFQNNYRENDTLYQFLDSSTSVCNLNTYNKVFIISDKNVQLCINENKRVVLYCWGPFCKSDFCYPLAVIYAKCQKNDILFLPIAEYYDNDLMTANLDQGFPILAPNIAYYKTNFADKYTSQFYSNLKVESHLNGRFYYFNEGEFVRGFKEIGVIDSL